MRLLFGPHFIVKKSNQWDLLLLVMHENSGRVFLEKLGKQRISLGLRQWSCNLSLKSYLWYTEIRKELFPHIILGCSSSTHASSGASGFSVIGYCVWHGLTPNMFFFGIAILMCLDHGQGLCPGWFTGSLWGPSTPSAYL